MARKYIIPFLMTILGISTSIAQTVNFVSGYAYSVPTLDQFNEAIEIRNSALDWEEPFVSIRNTHSLQFAIRRVSDYGFIGFGWEQKLKFIEGLRFRENNREIEESLSFAVNLLSLESAFRLGRLYIGAGIQGSKWTTKFNASFIPKRVPLFRDFNIGNIFFLEFDLTPSSSIELSLRPFYQLAWRETDYQKLNFFLGNLTPNYKEYNDFWGIGLIIKNGPKPY